MSGLVVLLGIPVFLMTYDPYAGIPSDAWIQVEWPGGRVVWTVAIAMLPLFIVAIGFYTWREICPLAFISRTSEWVRWPDRRTTKESDRRRRRVSPWLARNYPALTWAFLTATLALRILLINSNATALAATFVGLMLLAMLTGFLYTGKSWCNFLCPVGTIQRIYTDGDRPQYKHNSQCVPCTSCKTIPSGKSLCPDINQENDYWQELPNQARAVAYYAFPGTVLGFYVWYFLHKPTYAHDLWASGVRVVGSRVIPSPRPGTKYDMGYYFSGDWTRNPRPWEEWWEPGFGFRDVPVLQPIIDRIPTIVAAPLTLVLFSLGSYLIFRGLESIWLHILKRRGRTGDNELAAVRHPLFVWAAFIAFNLFYLFAGAPTFQRWPMGLYALFLFGVPVFSAWALVTRLKRTRRTQIQDDQARRWVKAWPWAEESVPADLGEAYTTYTLRMQFSADRVRVFKEAVRGALANNLVAAHELRLFDRLAQDLGIRASDESKIIRELSKESPEFFDPGYKGTLRDRLRLIGYRGELERAISEAGSLLPHSTKLAEMQTRYRIQPTEHEEILAQLRDPRGARAENLRREVADLEQLRGDVAALASSDALSIQFLRQELEMLVRDACDHVLGMANLYGPTGELDALRVALKQSQPGAREPTAQWLRDHLPVELAGDVVSAVCSGPVTGDPDPAALARVLLKLSGDVDLYIRAAALYSIRQRLGAGELSPEEREEERRLADAALGDPRPLIRDAAARQQTEHEAPLTTLEKLFALRNTKLLAHLPAELLHHLAESAEEHVFGAGETLCRQGEFGDALYIGIEGLTETVQTVGGVERRLGVNRPGETVGEMAVIHPAPRIATVRAIDGPVRVLTFRGKDFPDLLGHDAAVTLGIIRLMISRQREREAGETSRQPSD